MFSCDYCKISQNIFFYKTPLAASLNGSAEQNSLFFRPFRNFIKSSIWKMCRIYFTFNIMCFYCEKVVNSFQNYCASYLCCRFNNKRLVYADYFKFIAKSTYNRAFKKTNQDIGFELLKLAYTNPKLSLANQKTLRKKMNITNIFITIVPLV